MIDYSKPQRMSVSAFLIIFVKILKTIAWPLCIYIIIRVYDSGSILSAVSLLVKILITAAIAVGGALCLALVSYLSMKFYVTTGNLIFCHGLIQRETTTIPLDRIHSLRTKCGLIYRMLGLRGITFDTIASKGGELELILDEADWQNLLQLIEKEEKPAPSMPDVTAAPAYATVRMSNKDLLLDAFCQNHLKGVAVLAGFLAVVYNRVSDFNDNAMEEIADYTWSHFEEAMLTPLFIVSGLAGIYLVVVLLWLGKALLKHFDTTLTIDDNLITSEGGLLARSSHRCSLSKVCTVWIKRNFFERKLGLGTMMLRQALNATSDKEEDNIKIYGKDYSDVILRWWLGNDYHLSPEIITSRSGKGMLMHAVAKPFALAAVAIIILCHYRLYVWTSIPLLYLIATLLNGICAVRRSKITLHGDYLTIFNGHFADIRNYLKYDNLQVVRLRRTPFSRWFHRVSLILSTPGTTFSVRSLKEDEATLIFEYLLRRIETTPASESCAPIQDMTEIYPGEDERDAAVSLHLEGVEPSRLEN